MTSIPEIASAWLALEPGLTTVIISDAFTVSADAMADLRGAPGYLYLTTAHPVANLTADGVQARAERAVPAVAAMLTETVLAAAQPA